MYTYAFYCYCFINGMKKTMLELGSNLMEGFRSKTSIMTLINSDMYFYLD